MNITDEMLHRAAFEVSMDMINSLPEPEDCNYEFSPRFHRRMRKLLHTGKKYPVLRKVMAAALAIIFVVSCWLGVDKKAQAVFLSWMQTQYENIFVYHFFGSQTASNFPDYTLGWLPEGYVETSRTQTGVITLCTYSGPDGGVIFFKYVPMSDDGFTAIMSNGIEPESVYIDGLEGNFYRSEDDSQTNELVWFAPDSYMVFELSSFFDKSVMIYMAQNTFLEYPTK